LSDAGNATIGNIRCYTGCSNAKLTPNNSRSAQMMARAAGKGFLTAEDENAPSPAGAQNPTSGSLGLDACLGTRRSAFRFAGELSASGSVEESSPEVSSDENRSQARYDSVRAGGLSFEGQPARSCTSARPNRCAPGSAHTSARRRRALSGALPDAAGARLRHAGDAQRERSADLENNLIKQYKPRYNIRLKDDKSYLSAKVTNHSWPRIMVTAGSSRTAANISVRSARRWPARDYRCHPQVFPLRTCSDSVFKNRARPCLEYQIKRCLGRVACRSIATNTERICMPRRCCWKEKISSCSARCASR